MRKLLAYTVSAVVLLHSASCAEDVLQYADPLVGTADNGHTFPAACVPFGFVQPGPDSGNCRWEYTAGFNIADSTLIGFSQNPLIWEISSCCLSPVTRSCATILM